MAANIRHSSATPEHFTPPSIIDAARKLMGGIDLDPATTTRANKSMVKATNFFTAKNNGFTKSWHGRVFLNPPGGRCDKEGRQTTYVKNVGWCYENGKVADGTQSSAKAWWFKLIDEYVAGRVTEAVFVGFSIEILQTTQLAWRTRPIPLDFPMCFPKRRIRFWVDTGDRLNSSLSCPFVESAAPTHASVIIYLPTSFLLDAAASLQRFDSCFSEIGYNTRGGRICLH